MIRATIVMALALASCSSVDKKTQITIALSSETEIPKELDSFAVRIISTRTGELRFSQDYFPTSGREFPTTLAVIPLDEDALASPVRVEIEGRKGSAIFLRRQSVVSYLKDRNILLAMPLRMACFQFRDCGPNSTCSGGQCVADAIDGAHVTDYDAALVFGRPGGCFDEERCLGGATEIAIEQDCTFAIPAGADGANGNVAIRWAAAPERILALDATDAQEGWMRLAADRGKLSQGACDSHFQRHGGDGALLVADWAKSVHFSPSCASKTPRLPYCFSEATQHSGVGAVVP